MSTHAQTELDEDEKALPPAEQPREDADAAETRAIPEEVVAPPAAVTYPQHRPAAPEADAKTACRVDTRDIDRTYERREYTSSRELCQHQSCFGADSKLAQDAVAVDEDLTEYEEPVLQSSSGGRIHKLAEDTGLPQCQVRIESGQWVVIEGADLDFERGDVERCCHQLCFGITGSEKT